MVTERLLMGRKESNQTNFLKRPLKKNTKKWFSIFNYSLMQVKSITGCSKGSILQYFWPSLSYQFVIKTFVLSIFKWPCQTGFTGSQWGRESWLLCFVCLPDVSWLVCGCSSRCHWFVRILWLWYFLIILTIFTVVFLPPKISFI